MAPGSHALSQDVHGTLEVDEEHLRGVFPEQVAVTAFQGRAGDYDATVDLPDPDTPMMTMGGNSFLLT
jgi:hypothetical protein